MSTLSIGTGLSFTILAILWLHKLASLVGFYILIEGFVRMQLLKVLSNMKDNFWIILFVLLLIGGLVALWFLAKPQTLESRYSSLMIRISSEDELNKYKEHFTEQELLNLEGNYTGILRYMSQRMYYSREEFERSEDPEKIIWGPREDYSSARFTGKLPGRCGEYAIGYQGLCNLFHVKARLVVDTTGDHIWNEVWIDDRWVHVDPTEVCSWMVSHPSGDSLASKRIDNSSMYEKEWGKTIQLVLAFHTDGSWEDVTKRYKSNA